MPVTSNILIVGALYQDTILHVNGFPGEDTKQRAEKVEVRRGGNAGNTVEVLAQFPRMNTWLMSSLASKDVSSSLISDLEASGVKTTACVFRKKLINPSSYILHNKQNGSRTIISYNDIDDITSEEFKKKIDYASITRAISFADTPLTFNWIHFEGRNVDNVARMIDWIDAKAVKEGWRSSLTISVEFEKPDRERIDMLMDKADVLFFSKLFAHTRGFDHPADFLKSLEPQFKPNAIAFCTWGSQGASLFHVASQEVIHASALPVHQVVDSVGAGDTFIAGIIYTLCRGFTPLNSLKFACELATRKVAQSGFHNLADTMQKVWDAAIGTAPNGGAAAGCEAMGSAAAAFDNENEAWIGRVNTSENEAWMTRVNANGVRTIAGFMERRRSRSSSSLRLLSEETPSLDLEESLDYHSVGVQSEPSSLSLSI